MRVRHHICRLAAVLGLASLAPAGAPAAEPLPPGGARCGATVWADVGALDQPIMINRLGTVRPGGMIYALRRDVVATDGGTTLSPGKVELRRDRRPRPLTLRVNKGN